MEVTARQGLRWISGMTEVERPLPDTSRGINGDSPDSTVGAPPETARKGDDGARSADGASGQDRSSSSAFTAWLVRYRRRLEQSVKDARRP